MMMPEDVEWVTLGVLDDNWHRLMTRWLFGCFVCYFIVFSGAEETGGGGCFCGSWEIFLWGGSVESWSSFSRGVLWIPGDISLRGFCRSWELFLWGDSVDTGRYFSEGVMWVPEDVSLTRRIWAPFLVNAIGSLNTCGWLLHSQATGSRPVHISWNRHLVNWIHAAWPHTDWGEQRF